MASRDPKEAPANDEEVGIGSDRAHCCAPFKFQSGLDAQDAETVARLRPFFPEGDERYAKVMNSASRKMALIDNGGKLGTFLGFSLVACFALNTMFGYSKFAQSEFLLFIMIFPGFIAYICLRFNAARDIYKEAEREWAAVLPTGSVVGTEGICGELSSAKEEACRRGDLQCKCETRPGDHTDNKWPSITINFQQPPPSEAQTIDRS